MEIQKTVEYLQSAESNFQLIILYKGKIYKEDENVFYENRNRVCRPSRGNA